MLKFLKLTFWKFRGVNNTLRHSLFRESPPAKDRCHCESFRFAPRDSHIRNTTNNMDVLIFQIRFVSHASFPSIGRSRSPTGISPPLSRNVCSSGASKAKREMVASVAAALTTDSVSSWVELISSSRMTLFSDTLSCICKESGYYMVIP